MAWTQAAPDFEEGDVFWVGTLKGGVLAIGYVASYVGKAPDDDHAVLLFLNDLKSELPDIYRTHAVGWRGLVEDGWWRWDSTIEAPDAIIPN